MAEERLIDEDKDRKYKIRVNEDGEEELVIVPDGTEEEEQQPETVLEVPEFDTDDEEAAVMTPEQLAAREKARQEDAAARKLKAGKHLVRAKELMETPDYENALAEITLAEELYAEDGETQILKLKALTKDFTEFSETEAGLSTIGEIKKYATEEQRTDLGAYAPLVAEKLKQTKSQAEALGKENTEKQAERESLFTARRKSAVIGLVSSAVPMAVFVILTIVFGLMIHSVLAYTYLILTIIFGALAGVAFIVLLIMAHKLWDAQRKLKLNKKNSSSRLGRAFEEAQAECELLSRINCLVNGDDIS